MDWIGVAQAGTGDRLTWMW